MNKRGAIQVSTYGHSSGYEEVSKGEKQTDKFNDVFWGVLFFIHLGIMVMTGVTYIPQLEQDVRNQWGYQNDDNNADAAAYYNNDAAAYYNNDDANRKLLMDPMNLYDGYNGSDTQQQTIGSRVMKVMGKMYLSISNQFNSDDYGIHMDERTRALEENYDSSNVEPNPNSVLILVILITIVAIIFSTLSLAVIIKFAEPLIKLSVFMNVVIGAVMAIIGLVENRPELIIFGAIVFLVAGCYAYFIWSRIPYAATNLVTATTSIQANLGVTFFAWAAIFLSSIWMVYWSFASYSTIYILGDCDMEGNCAKDVNGIIIFLLTLSLYWTQQVIKNVVHVTVAGTVGTWWWAPFEADSFCSDGVRSSHSRALTYSFGSICFGSLVVAIVQAIKSMLEQARESGDGTLLCIADCIIGCMETILEVFNKWAFVYIGLYGYNFVESAKNVMILFRARGWTAIVTDYIVDRVLTLVSSLIGVAVGAFAALISYAVGLDLEEFAFFLGLLIGFILTAVLLSVVSSAVNTIIVCYAEDPGSFDTNHFELSNRMRQSWRVAFPDDFNY